MLELFINIEKVTEPQIWRFHGEDIVVCDDDLYLDLVVYPDGAIIEDDMDELEKALFVKDISKEQYSLAINTSVKLKEGILNNIESFITYTYKCLEMVN